MLYFDFWTILVHGSFDESSHPILICPYVNFNILTQTTSGPPVVQHTFLYISLPLFCTTTKGNFLVTLFMEEMSYVLLVGFFFTASYFHLGGCYHFSFSHHSYKIFLLFLHLNSSPLLCISPSSPFSVMQGNVDIEI